MWTRAKNIGLYAWCVVGILSNQTVQFQVDTGDPCINFQNGHDNTTTCSSSSTWAVNLPTLTISHEIYTDAIPTFRIEYYFRLKNGFKLKLCKYVLTKIGCDTYGAYCISCATNHLGKPNGSVNAIFDITNLGSNKDGSILQYKFLRGEPDGVSIHTFSISACTATETRKTSYQSSSYRITASDEGNYDSIGKCACNEPGEVLYEVDGTRSSGTARCGYYAEWEGCNELQCWSGPDISAVEQIKNSVGSSNPFNCDFDEGFPISTKTAFQINGMDISDSYVLKSDDHGKEFSCEVISKYTISENKPAMSRSKTIQVYFPPEKSTVSQKSLFMTINNPQSISYSVFTNPYDQTVNITWNKLSSGTYADFTMIYNRTEITQYTYVFNITVRSVEDYGAYVMCSETKNPRGIICDKIEILDAEPVAYQGISTTVIAVIVVGGVLVLIFIVFLLCKKKRGAENIDESKEMKNNELYGSTQYQTPSRENRESAMQETPAVRYVSVFGRESEDVVEYEYALDNPEDAAEGPSGSSAVYAQINKKKGNLNDEFDIEAQDSEPGTPLAIYMVVDKAEERNEDAGEEDKVFFTTSAAQEEPSCSNSAVYARINKKKGNLKDEFDIEAQDSEPGTSEAIYTIVDKTERKQDDIPEVYAVLNKPRKKG